MDHLVLYLEHPDTTTPQGVLPGPGAVTMGCAALCTVGTEAMEVYGPGQEEDLRNRLLGAWKISGWDLHGRSLPWLFGLGSKPEAWWDCPVMRLFGAQVGLLNEQGESLLKDEAGWISDAPRATGARRRTINDLTNRLLLGLKLNQRDLTQQGAVHTARAKWALESVVLGTLRRRLNWLAKGRCTRLFADALAADKIIDGVNTALEAVAALRELLRFVDKYGYLIHGQTKEQILLAGEHD
jgi:hypothetical protein